MIIKFNNSNSRDKIDHLLANFSVLLRQGNDKDYHIMSGCSCQNWDETTTMLLKSKPMIFFHNAHCSSFVMALTNNARLLKLVPTLLKMLRWKMQRDVLSQFWQAIHKRYICKPIEIRDMPKPRYITCTQYTYMYIVSKCIFKFICTSLETGRKRSLSRAFLSCFNVHEIFLIYISSQTTYTVFILQCHVSK